MLLQTILIRHVSYPILFPERTCAYFVYVGLNWYNACKNRIQDTGGVRPGMSNAFLFSSMAQSAIGVTFRLLLDMKIVGLPSSYGASTQVSGAPCPIELPTNSV